MNENSLAVRVVFKSDDYKIANMSRSQQTTRRSERCGGQCSGVGSRSGHKAARAVVSSGGYWRRSVRWGSKGAMCWNIWRGSAPHPAKLTKVRCGCYRSPP